MELTYWVHERTVTWETYSDVRVILKYFRHVVISSGGLHRGRGLEVITIIMVKHRDFEVLSLSFGGRGVGLGGLKSRRTWTEIHLVSTVES